MNNYFDGNGTVGFTCDACGRETRGCSYVNGMYFCAKCYQETFGNKNNMTENLNNMYDDYSKILAEKDVKIADLEAKLAEYEDIMKDYNIQDLTELDEFLAKYDFDEDEDGNIVSQVIVGDQKYIDIDYFATIYKENKQLKQQLAEKDKEIEKLKHFKVTIGTMENNQVDISSTTYIDQDKISFAIEQLEKVRELCHKKFDWWENSEWEGNLYDKSDVSNAYFDIEANIDQQIVELKKGK